MAAHRTAATPSLTDLLFDRSGDGLCLVGPDGRVLRANAEWLRSTGLTADQVIGEDVTELFPDTRDEALAMYARARAGHHVEVPRHARVVHGSKTWWEGFVDPVPMAVGTGLLITTHEVDSASTRPRAAPFGRAAERLQAVADGAPFAVFVKDASGRYLFANRYVAELLGHAPEEIVGRTVEQILPQSIALRTRQRETRAGEEGHVWTEDAIPTPNGERVMLTARFPIPMDGGEAGICGIAFDVTERNRIEREVRSAKERLEETVATLKEGHYALDAQWRFIAANEVARRHFPSPPEGLIGHDIWELTRTPAESDLRQRFEEARATGQPVHFEAASRVQAGYWAELHLYPRADGVLDVYFSDVSERKRAEDALRDREERFRSSFANAAIGFAMTAPDGRFVDANPTYCAITGYSVEELHDLAFSQLIHPDDHAANMTLNQRMLAGEIPDFVIENRYVRKAGDAVWVRKSVSVARAVDGSPRWIIALVEDITARKLAEAALRTSEASLKRAQEIAHLGSWELDLATNRLTWSDEVYRIFGLRPQEFAATYQAFLERVHPDDRGAVDAAYSASLREGRDSYEIEHRVVRKDTGEVRDVHEKCQHVRDAQGRIVCSLGMVHDVTERKHAEQALRESEEKLRLAKDAARMGAWDWNLLSGELTWTDRCKELFGLAPDATLSYEVLKATIHPDDVAPVERVIREAFATGNDYDAVMRVPLSDGSVRWVEAKGRAFVGARGQPVRMAGMVIDITERKEMEEQLREADRRKDEFLAMLSHELRNPLAPIRNSTYVLRHAPLGSEQSRRAQTVIERQTTHLTRLVDDLLDVTRIARGKIELRRERVDLREVLWRAADDFRAIFADRGVSLRPEIAETNAWADADATRVTQIIGNLLNNAAKFTKRGDEVTLTLRAAGGKAEITVRDTGAGIDATLLPRIFEPFVQGERTLSRSEGGLGLGLALAKGIAELHGGTVRAESAGQGKGAEFIVQLPIVEAAAIQPAASVRAPRGNGGRRVLVVDDNVDGAESLADVVRMLGHVVEAAYDGPTAIEKARANPPEIVLCDIGLPGMSGYDVAKALRACACGMQLFAVTGYARPEDVKNAIQAGFDGHLAKPLNIEDVERLLE